MENENLKILEKKNLNYNINRDKSSNDFDSNKQNISNFKFKYNEEPTINYNCETSINKETINKEKINDEEYLKISENLEHNVLSKRGSFSLRKKDSINLQAVVRKSCFTKFDLLKFQSKILVSPFGYY